MRRMKRKGEGEVDEEEEDSRVNPQSNVHEIRTPSHFQEPSNPM